MQLVFSGLHIFQQIFLLQKKTDCLTAMLTNYILSSSFCPPTVHCIVLGCFEEKPQAVQLDEDFSKICVMCADNKTFCKVGKNAWTSDMKLCNYIVCSAEGSPLCNS